MYTFGYLREAVMANVDLDEAEMQAMRQLERLHIFANEGITKISGLRPKITYFTIKIVNEFHPLIWDNSVPRVIRKATDLEIKLQKDFNLFMFGNPTPTEVLTWLNENNINPALMPGHDNYLYDWVDEEGTCNWYYERGIALTNHQIRMPLDFIGFANRQAWGNFPKERDPEFNSEKWIVARYNRIAIPFKRDIGPRRVFAPKDFVYNGSNQLVFYKEGTFKIPYKAVWYRFISGIEDQEPIDIPFNILTTLALYVAAKVLQIDHAQKANVKMAEYERAISDMPMADFTEMNEFLPTFR